MISNSAKLDSSTKQHTQSRVSTSLKIVAEKKKEKKQKTTKRIGWQAIVQN